MFVSTGLQVVGARTFSMSLNQVLLVGVLVVVLVVIVVVAVGVGVVVLGVGVGAVLVVATMVSTVVDFSIVETILLC